MMRGLAGVALLLVLVCAGGVASAQSVEAPIQKNYEGVSISVEKRTALVIIAWPYSAGGRLVVCGFHFPEAGGQVPKETRNALLRTLIVELNGKPLTAQPMEFTAYPDEATAVAKSKGRCSGTRLAWSDDYAKTKLKIYGRRSFIRE